MNRIGVGVLGATGVVGQRLISALANHPWFYVAEVAASDRSTEQRYRDVVRWKLAEPLPENVAEMIVQPCEPDALSAKVQFSALPSEIADRLETDLAALGYLVISNASSHRMDPDVPLVIPEVNPDHLGLLDVQRQNRGWPQGGLVTNPNCSTIHLTLALKPLHDAFGIKRLMVTTLQAVSGAGYPGQPSLDIIDNVVPYIGGGEEDKIESEPQKLLGAFTGDRITPAGFVTSAAVHRVAVSDGHTEAVSIEFERKPSLGDLTAALRQFRALPQELGLPSAPEHPILVREEVDRPQPRFDRDHEHGMATIVGRIRPCPVLDYKFVLLGHNTIRGAAGAVLLNAELLRHQELI